MREKQERYWEDVQEGDELPSLQFPLSVYRLVMAASANQDFNSIHHNSEYAKKTGAPDMYANNIFLQGMWERTVREYIGNAGVSELPSTYHPCGLLEVGASRVILSHDRKLTELTLLFREFVFSC